VLRIQRHFERDTKVTWKGGTLLTRGKEGKHSAKLGNLTKKLGGRVGTWGKYGVDRGVSLVGGRA